MVWYHYPLLFSVALAAGAINSVAGGGTLLTFPTLLWTGLVERIANATSTVALWPGQLSSFWGYRSEIGRQYATILALSVPSFLGGWLGATLLVRSRDETFAAIVPYLVLAATCLFMAQEPLGRWLAAREQRLGSLDTGPSGKPEPCPLPSSVPFSPFRWAALLVYQFFVATYGGYFGAGIGILMLAGFGFLGLRNIHQMNGLKNINGMCINAVAAAMFTVQGLVNWRAALVMAAGAIVGGYAGAGTARRIGQRNVRRLVVVIGLALSILLLVRRLSLA